jgi:flavorubredoxin
MLLNQTNVLLFVAAQVADLKYNTLANGHGPILRYNVEQLVTNYRDWSMAVEKGSTQVRGLNIHTV